MSDYGGMQAVKCPQCTCFVREGAVGFCYCPQCGHTFNPLQAPPVARVLRGNVARHLPVVRRQALEAGWPSVRECMVKGKTKFLSRKDRYQIVQILDAEFNQTHGLGR